MPLAWDAAHVPFSAKGQRTEREPLDELLSAIAGKNEDVSVAQLRGQSMELAGHLQQQQQQLDQREADFNARMAAVENEMRAARLKAIECERHTSERNQTVARTASTFTDDLNREPRESLGVGLYDQVASLTNQTAPQPVAEIPADTTSNQPLNLHSETTDRWKSGLSVYNEIPEIVAAEKVDESAHEIDPESLPSDLEDGEVDPVATAHRSDWLTARRQVREEDAQSEVEITPSVDHLGRRSKRRSHRRHRIGC